MPSPCATVLVVEDEALIRLETADVLSDAGFTVIEAVHAADALTILDVRCQDIHALFTDIHMPGEMNGLQLAHHTNHHWPWITLRVASGQATPAVDDLPKGCRFLAKPYDPQHVVRHVRELTSGSPGEAGELPTSP